MYYLLMYACYVKLKHKFQYVVWYTRNVFLMKTFQLRIYETCIWEWRQLLEFWNFGRDAVITVKLDFSNYSAKNCINWLSNQSIKSKITIGIIPSIDFSRSNPRSLDCDLGTSLRRPQFHWRNSIRISRNDSS